MYSSLSITLFRIMIFGYKIKCFPFKLITIKNIPKLQVPKNNSNYFKWKFATIISTLIQIIILLIGLIYDIIYRNRSKLIHRAQFYVLVPVILLGIMTKIALYFSCDNYISLFNSFAIFGQKLRKFFVLSCVKVYLIICN